MNFREDILKCYNIYKDLKPLDIFNYGNFENRKNLYQLSIIDYCRILGELRECKSFDNIIKNDFDYDNLFIIIESLILAGFLIIGKNGAFIWEGLEKNVFYYSKTNLIYDTPKSDYNCFTGYTVYLFE